MAGRPAYVVACGGGAVTGVEIEPARFGMTGPECGIFCTMRRDVDSDAIQPLDAPEYIARGSLQAGHTTDAGLQYVNSTFAMPARMYGGAK